MAFLRQRQSLKSFASLAFLVFLPVSCQSVWEDPAQQKRRSQLLATKLDYAQSQIDSGHPETALRTLRPLLEQHPDNTAVINLLGITHLALDNSTLAAKYFYRAYARDQKVPFGLNLSAALIALGKYRRSRTILRKLLNSTGYNLKERIYHNVALSYERESNHRRALYFYRRALQENPAYYLSSLRMARILKKLNRLSQSIQSYQKAFASCTSCYEAVHELAIIYMHQSNFTSAVNVLSRFLSGSKISGADRSQAQKLLRVVRKGTRI